MQFHEENDLFDFTSFFARNYLNFLAHCAKVDIEKDARDHQGEHQDFESVGAESIDFFGKFLGACFMQQ